MVLTEKHFSIGETVYDRVRPNQKLTVTRICDNIYYCQTQEKSGKRLLVFFEKDLHEFDSP